MVLAAQFEDVEFQPDSFLYWKGFSDFIGEFELWG